MNPAFFPGPIDFEATYGLALHAEDRRKAETDRLSAAIRKELLAWQASFANTTP